MELPKTSRRTELSKWVYRTTLTLFAVATIRFGQSMYNAMPQIMMQSSGAAYWSSLFSWMAAPIGTLVVVIALALRSGAVVWLIGLEFLRASLTIMPAFLGTGSKVPAIFGIFGWLIILAFGATVLTYLVRKEEIRHP